MMDRSSSTCKPFSSASEHSELWILENAAVEGEAGVEDVDIPGKVPESINGLH
jgi:hypothetical protein